MASESGEDKDIEIGVESTQNRDATSELKELVEVLRDSILELKATLTEMSSPLAGMKRQGVEEDDEALAPVSASSALTSKTGVMLVEKPRESKGQQNKEGELDDGSEKPSGDGSSTQVERKPARPQQQPAGANGREDSRITFKKSIKILKLLYKLSDSIPPSQVENYTRLFQALGLLDGKIAETISVLKDIVEVGRESGIDPEDQIIAIYSIAKILGIADPELEEEIAFSLVERVCRRSPRSSGGG